MKIRGLFLIILCILLCTGCTAKNKTVTDPCSKAPTMCWYSEKYPTPETNPSCVGLMKCYKWKMTAM